MILRKPLAPKQASPPIWPRSNFTTRCEFIHIEVRRVRWVEVTKHKREATARSAVRLPLSGSLDAAPDGRRELAHPVARQLFVLHPRTSMWMSMRSTIGPACSGPFRCGGWCLTSATAGWTRLQSQIHPDRQRCALERSELVLDGVGLSRTG